MYFPPLNKLSTNLVGMSFAEYIPKMKTLIPTHQETLQDNALLMSVSG
jgi:hypothetical protein